MARVSIYLNYARSTEKAFLFYRDVFRTQFTGEIARLGDVPSAPGQPPVAQPDQDLVMHGELPIVAGHVLMGTDAPESRGFAVNFGNNQYINLGLDDRAGADRLFAALADGGTVERQLQPMFWGAVFGSLRDRFGVQWMVNCPG